MTGLLAPGLLVQASHIALDHEPLPAEQVISGAPTTATAVLVEGEPEIGVWEITPGVSTDVEVDEVFIVLSGRATLEMPGFDPVELTAGCVVQLAEGMATTWTVHETLRKVYVI